MSQTPFHDLDDFLALPRLSGLALSPDGSRLVTGVTTLDAKSTKYVTALWEIDPAGVRPARRLTRAAKGESSAAFAADGSVLFVSARPDPEASEGQDDVAAVWQLPLGAGSGGGGGEARLVLKRPGGVGTLVTARRAPGFCVVCPTLPAAVTGDDDAERRKVRKERKVSAILHERYPIRYWDHDLGPDEPRLLLAALPDAVQDAVVPPRDLTPGPGRALDEAQVDLAPDGAWLATTWQLPEAGGQRFAIAVIGADRPVPAGTAPRVLLDSRDYEFFAPRISPDGDRLACIAENRTTATVAPSHTVVVADVETGAWHRVDLDWDGWVADLAWTPDGSALILAADLHGRGPLFRLDLASGALTRLSADDGAYTNPVVSPDGRLVYALRSAVDRPPLPVRLAAAAPDQQPTYLPAPANADPQVPSRLEEVHATAEDGTPLRGWLVLPQEASAEAAASPAPFLLWIHGGPIHSWNAWSWRWNPHLMAAQGYAVLLPDPALSTGYGQAMIERGWGAWGQAPYTDLMTLTDAAIARPDVDETRTAAMGGSFGGYMANWLAGHTERFRGIVTHASLWALDQFGPTTDAAYYWRREMTPEMALANSPHRFVRDIRTPMLVVHGDKDYRVPVGEALRLWAELAEVSSDAQGRMPHKLLYFPDENHWVLAPQNAKVWYQTVFAFLASTVLGQEWATPEVLR